MEKVVSGDIELFTSNAPFEELSRVLDYPKFGFNEDQKVRFKALISSVAIFVSAPARLDIIKEDPADNVILDCATMANADFSDGG